MFISLFSEVKHIQICVTRAHSFIFPLLCSLIHVYNSIINKCLDLEKELVNYMYDTTSFYYFNVCIGKEIYINRPLPSCLLTLGQNESLNETIHTVFRLQVYFHIFVQIKHESHGSHGNFSWQF